MSDHFGAFGRVRFGALGYPVTQLGNPNAYSRSVKIVFAIVANCMFDVPS